MHDLDSTLMGTDQGFEVADEGEFYGENEFIAEGEGEGEGEGEALGEGEINELAADLLSVSHEGELDQFLGDIFKKVAHAAGSFIKGPIGQQLGGMLKGLAKKALPIAGAALGNLVAPGVGGLIGGKLASAAGSAFGLELEGLSAEDGEFEVAKQFVRLAADAARNTVGVDEIGNPYGVAQNALTQAMQRYAPGLLNDGWGQAHPHHRRQSGRWVRRGDQIILYGI